MQEENPIVKFLDGVISGRSGGKSTAPAWLFQDRTRTGHPTLCRSECGEWITPQHPEGNRATRRMRDKKERLTRKRSQ